MQFYIIHPDPEKNVELLPEYALRKVNVREGWQILSDIGHIHDVHWEGQNKLYSASHVLTRSFCVNRERFVFFVDHYDFCVDAVGGSFADKFIYFITQAYHSLRDKIPEDRDEFQFAKEYLLNQKRKHLTDEDVKRLSE